MIGLLNFYSSVNRPKNTADQQNTEKKIKINNILCRPTVKGATMSDAMDESF